jgi:hypothetical protein
MRLVPRPTGRELLTRILELALASAIHQPRFVAGLREFDTHARVIGWNSGD